MKIEKWCVGKLNGESLISNTTDVSVIAIFKCIDGRRIYNIRQIVPRTKHSVKFCRGKFYIVLYRF